MLHTAHEYISFIVLVGSLFVVSGGIHIGVKGEATPFANVIFLLAGAIVANVLGTTGAAMLLIRPWIRMNKYRVTAHHIVFFIFIVANVGGCLTPIGDPPLFLGYLQGVPFWWVAKLLADVGGRRRNVARDVLRRGQNQFFPRAARRARKGNCGRTMELRAACPICFLLAVIFGAVFVNRPIFLREALMLAAATASYFTTKKSVHEANHFDFHPISEVAILFAGIFATMMPALDWLAANAREILGASPHPGIFFWSAGSLSAVLDNAPTYLGFLTALSGLTHPANAVDLLDRAAMGVIAMSVGSVFFGAATYIGNDPNFMVKSIAGQQKIRMPGFLGFVFKFALPFLLPVLMAVWLVFFRG